MILLLGAALMIAGSIGAWATASVGPISLSLSGTDKSISHSYGLNGWVTFALGMLLAILVILEVVNKQPVLGSLTLLVSFVAVGFAIYFFARVLHDILKAQPHQLGILPGPSLDLGWGIIVLLIGAVGAFAASVADARNT